MEYEADLQEYIDKIAMLTIKLDAAEENAASIKAAAENYLAEEAELKADLAKTKEELKKEKSDR